MTKNDMGSQLWSLLVDSAHAQKVLTYAIVEQLTGVPKQAMRCLLAPIHDYCQRQNLPPLTSLVVNEIDSSSSERITATKDRFGDQARVYLFDWSGQKSPSPDDLQHSTKQTIHEMPWYGDMNSPFNLGHQSRSDSAWDN